MVLTWYKEAAGSAASGFVRRLENPRFVEASYDAIWTCKVEVESIFASKKGQSHKTFFL